MQKLLIKAEVYVILGNKLRDFRIARKLREWLYDILKDRSQAVVTI